MRDRRHHLIRGRQKFELPATPHQDAVLLALVLLVQVVSEGSFINTCNSLHHGSKFMAGHIEVATVCIALVEFIHLVAHGLAQVLLECLYHGTIKIADMLADVILHVPD